MNKTPHATGSTLARNALWNVAGTVIPIAVSFIFSPIIVGILGTSKYGLLALLNAALGPLGLAYLNVPQANVKYIAQYCSRGEYDNASRTIGTTFSFTLLIGSLLCGIILLAASWLAGHAFSIAEEDRALAREIIFWLAVGWPLGSFAGNFSAIPVALQNYRLLTIVNVVFNLLSVAGPILTLYLTNDIISYLQAGLLFQAANACVWVYLAKHMLPNVSFVPSWSREAFRKLFKYGSWQTVSAAGGFAFLSADKYLLGITVSTASVGFYQIASSVQGYAVGILGRFGDVLFPFFSVADAERTEDREFQFLIRSSWLLSVLSACIAVPVFVFGGDFLSLWMSKQVSAGATPVLRVLLIAGLLNSSANAGISFLMGKGHTFYLAIGSLIMGVTVVVTSIILVPRIGLAGAGWGAFAAAFVQFGFTLIVYHKMFRHAFALKEAAWAMFGPTLLGALIALALGVMRGSLPIPVGWVPMIMGCMVCVLVSLGIILLCDAMVSGAARRRQDLKSATLHIMRIR